MADVDNPKYTFLKNLQDKVHQIQADMSKKMDKPTTNMESGNVWTSKTATKWKGELGGNAKAYNTALNNLDGELSNLLAGTPKKCSQAEADKWYAEQNSYNRNRRF